ncbi:hypothetical protein LWI29_017190 [Acer saccharum]|uniref:Uncharacterized protein n=1 Tax=Acer saccharum TaxID=4024 RepID=A0AA39W1C4_ACESA|nr:hypothetical protein LWI29_017190 [Acer saccharum]
MAAFDPDSSYYGDFGYEVERPRHRHQHQQLKRTVNEEVTAVDYHKEGDSSGHDHEQETDKDSGNLIINGVKILLTASVAAGGAYLGYKIFKQSKNKNKNINLRN